MLHKAEGGLITYIRDKITFTTTDIPSTINTHNTELQMVKVLINNTKHITIVNIFIPRTYISDNHAILCILDNVAPQNNEQNIIIKRIFCDKNITKFSKYLRNETWDIVYTEGGAQKAFTWFQGVMDLFFDNSFQKLILTMTYHNCFNWMTKKNAHSNHRHFFY